MGQRKEEQFATRFVSLGQAETGILRVHRRTADLSDPKYTKAVHWHDHFELELVVNGSAIHAVNGGSYRVTPGSLYLMTPTDLHTLLPDPDAPSSLLTVYSFSFSNTLIGETSFAEIAELPSPLTAQAAGETLDFLLTASRVLLEESRRAAPWGNEISRALFQSFVLTFLRLCCEQNRDLADAPKDPAGGMAKGESAYVRQAIGYIKYRFRDPEISIRQIARAVWLSPNYFGAIFKRHVGMSCLSYIKKLRMEFAAGLLLQSPLTVAEIAEKSGYPNISYFVCDFRQFWGDPPQKYRDAHQMKNS